MNDQDLDGAARLLAENLSAAELVSRVNRQTNILLHEREEAKGHFLCNVELSDAQIEEFCAHLFDGGGVVDTRSPLASGQNLQETWMQAVHDRDWPAIRKLMPHVVKSWMKEHALVKTFPGGGIQLSGMPTRDKFLKEGEGK